MQWTMHVQSPLAKEDTVDPKGLYWIQEEIEQALGGGKFVNYYTEKTEQEVSLLKIVGRWESINIDTFPTLALL